jgi:hypothetical protein
MVNCLLSAALNVLLIFASGAETFTLVAYAVSTIICMGCAMALKKEVNN